MTELDEYVPDDQAYRPPVRTHTDTGEIAKLKAKIAKLEERNTQLVYAHLEDIQRWQKDIQTLQNQITDLLSLIHTQGE